jgi:hypothetical protein
MQNVAYVQVFRTAGGKFREILHHQINAELKPSARIVGIAEER